MLSIIIPVYNAEKTLERALQSLKNQSFQDAELICVNDGSTDESLSLLKKAQKNDERIRIISTENQGVSAARNLGLDQARGEFIAFFDADDWAAPGYLQGMMEVMKSSQADFVYADWINDSSQDQSMDSFQSYGYEQDESRQTPDSLIRFYLKRRAGCAPWAKVFRRDLIESHQLRFPEDLPLSEDYIFILNYLTFCDSIAHARNSDFHYVLSLQGASRKIRTDYPEIEEKTFEKIDSLNERSDRIYSEEINISRLIYSARVIKYLKKIRQERPDWRKVLKKQTRLIRTVLKENPSLAGQGEATFFDRLVADLVHWHLDSVIEWYLKL